MARTPGRTTEDTRRLILDAAARVFRVDGISATLQEVAAAAGVSKGGLLYHFATKEDLVRSLGVDLSDIFRESVEEHIDPDDTAPGRLTRAYVHTCLDFLDDADTVLDHVVLTSHLQTDPGVAAHIRAEAQRWRRELNADGLPSDVLILVLSAADGASSAPIWAATIDAPTREALRTMLINITLDPALITGRPA